MASIDQGIPEAATALYKFLAALFTFINEQVEPKNLGVITAGKMRWVAERVGMQAEFAASLSLAPEVIADTYSDLECQYYIIPSKLSGGGVDADHDYGFEEPDVPGLTKAGFIKMQVLGLILEGGPSGGATPSGDMQYRFLQGCIRTFPLHHLDPNGNKITFPPMPQQHVVNWYVTTLAKTVLGITDPTPAGIQARVTAKRSQASSNQPTENFSTTQSTPAQSSTTSFNQVPVPGTQADYQSQQYGGYR